MVVVSAHAGGVHLLGDGFRNLRGHAYLHGTARLRGKKIDMRCVDTIAMYLLYTFIIDFSLEMLDLIHRIYEADESFRSLNFMVHTRLYIPHIVIQICLGTLVPLILLGITQVFKCLRPRASACLQSRA